MIHVISGIRQWATIMPRAERGWLFGALESCETAPACHFRVSNLCFWGIRGVLWRKSMVTQLSAPDTEALARNSQGSNSSPDTVRYVASARQRAVGTASQCRNTQRFVDPMRPVHYRDLPLIQAFSSTGWTDHLSVTRDGMAVATEGRTLKYCRDRQEALSSGFLG